jgi:hypothetical protein
MNPVEGAGQAVHVGSPTVRIMASADKALADPNVPPEWTARSLRRTAEAPLVHGHQPRCDQSRARRVRDFGVSGRTIRFSAGKLLPAALVKRIVKARLRQNEGLK